VGLFALLVAQQLDLVAAGLSEEREGPLKQVPPDASPAKAADIRAIPPA